MKSKLLHHDSEKTWAVIFDLGDDPMSGLERFAKENQLTAARFTAIGAFQNVTLAYFDWEKKDYRELPLDEQVEVLTMTGDVALKDGHPKVHAHLIVGRSDGTTRGGHLKQASVRPTLEVMLTESPGDLQRTYDETSGLALIDPTR
jgi:predicted DNA-binding protein with PD1-like motif